MEMSLLAADVLTALIDPASCSSFSRAPTRGSPILATRDDRQGICHPAGLLRHELPDRRRARAAADSDAPARPPDPSSLSPPSGSIERHLQWALRPDPELEAARERLVAAGDGRSEEYGPSAGGPRPHGPWPGPNRPLLDLAQLHASELPPRPYASTISPGRPGTTRSPRACDSARRGSCSPCRVRRRSPPA